MDCHYDTLLVANVRLQALNGLFSKIMKRDVPERHLLRLGTWT